MTATVDANTVKEPLPVLSRVERLDLMMSYLEEIKGSNKLATIMLRNSSCASTTSSGTVSTNNNYSDCGNSSVNSSPKLMSNMEKNCKTIEDVVVETQLKGSIIHRVDQLECRLLKLEEEIENEKKREGEGMSPRSADSKKHRKGLKTLVKSCMRGHVKTKD